MKKTLSPKRIYEVLSQNVIGQVEAKREIANILFTHYVNMQYRLMTGKSVKTSNFLLQGPSGNGKTLIINEGVRAVRSITGQDIMPLLNVDSTALHPEGWAGLNLSDVLESHRDVNSKEAFASTVMYFDEFDKLAMPMHSSGGGDAHKQMQYAMLTLVEGTDYKIPSCGMKSGHSIDVSNFLFVFSGNFPDIRKNRDDDKKTPMGIVPLEDKGKTNKDPEDLFIQLTKAGVATQLAGRISSVVEIKPLSKVELKEVMFQLLLPKVIDVYGFMNHTLHVPYDEIDKMVNKAFDRKTGARGLQASLTEYLRDTLFEQEIQIVDPYATLPTLTLRRDLLTVPDLFKPFDDGKDKDYTLEELDAMDLDPGMADDYFDDEPPEDDK